MVTFAGNMNSKLVHILFPVLGFLILLSETGCNSRNIEYDTPVKCDMETVTPDGKYFTASGDSSYTFNDGDHRSSDYARSGNYSLKLDKEFGFSDIIKNPQPGDFYFIDAWEYIPDGDKGAILVSTDKDPKYYYKIAKKHFETDSAGWKHFAVEFQIPEKMRGRDVKIYFWNQTKKPVYIDDYTILRRKTIDYPEFTFDEPLRLFIDSANMLKLNEVRNRAFENGVLESSDDDYVRAILFSGNNMMKAKVRLKGDWLDHLEGIKWSFRIKLSKKYSWRGMRTFSIQTPSARFYVSEWLAHKLFDDEGLLTTRYGFIPVILNNKNLGIYAYEEHFDKQLVESRKRREGPILKLDEDGFWETIRVSQTGGGFKTMPVYAAAEILPFKVNRTMKNPTLKKEFMVAQNLVWQYSYFKTHVSKLFNIDQLAKYYALLDITKSYHAVAWHNRRYYYDPVLSSLEPIIFDCYGGDGPYDNFKVPALGLFNEKLIKSNSERFPFFAFTDSVFIKRYIHYLEKYSEESFIKNLLKKYSKEIKLYKTEIAKEFKGYEFDTSFLLNDAAAIRNSLDKLKTKLKSTQSYEDIFNKSVLDDARIDTTQTVIPPDHYIKAYTSSVSSDTAYIEILNFYNKKITLLGTGKKQKRMTSFFSTDPKIVVPSYILTGEKMNIPTDTNAVFLFYIVDNEDEIHISPIYPWPYPRAWSPRQELIKEYAVNENSSFLKINGKNITFSGEQNLKEPVIIPKGYNVFFEPGTRIDFTDSAFLISYSPVFMNGTRNNPVKIYSSDGTANGFTVLQVNDRSKINYAVFDNLNTLSYKDWMLTGGVTFYESDVDITNTSILNNNCEDALNIVRSDFYVSNCKFDNIFSDAFDSDFCTGKAVKIAFTKVLNDAIDFSGSEILIDSLTISGANDKGISGGENSHLTVKNTDISNCNIGIASKDLSIVEVYNSSVYNCNYAMTAFRKKPEFGAATIITHSLKHHDNNTLHLIEEESQLILNDTLVNGTKKKVADIFYKK